MDVVVAARAQQHHANMSALGPKAGCRGDACATPALTRTPTYRGLSQAGPGWAKSRGLRAAHALEFLHPASPIGLCHVDVTLGIDGERMAVGEVAGLMARATEAREDLATRVIENVHLLGAAVHHVHELLLAIGREGDPPRCAALVRQLPARVRDRDVAHERPVFLENLDAVALAVASVDQAGIAHGDAMHDLGEHAGRAAAGLLLGGLASPLPQELAVLVEHRDAAVAVAVGDVDVAVAGIDHHAGGHVELVARGVEALAAPRAVDGIEFSARADLHQELSVRRIFLDGGVGIAGNPDVALLIDEAAVDRAGDRG